MRIGKEAGGIAVELAVVGPSILLLMALLLAGGRVALAHNAVEQAAADAARTASITRDAGTARTQAEASAGASLEQQGLECVSMTIDVDTSGFGVPVGQPASITATVTCTVRVSDLGIPGMPGNKTVDATSVSPLDTYRERS